MNNTEKRNIANGTPSTCEFWAYTRPANSRKYPSERLVLNLDGNSEIGAPARSNMSYLIFLKHLIRSRAATNRTYKIRKDIFSFRRAQHVLIYHLI